MKKISKIISFTERKLKKAVSQNSPLKCPECRHESIFKTSGFINIGDVQVENVPENICFYCGYEFVSLNVIEAIEEVLKEKGIINGKFVIPRNHFFQDSTQKAYNN